MSTTRDIAVIVGSLRKASLNRKMAHALAELAPAALELEIVEIGDLPLYNADIDDDASTPAYATFRERMQRVDGVIFVTPEYNRSIPAPLKNAIDVGSRPSGKGCLARKPAAVISVSPGALGAFGANQHVRQCLVALDMPTLAQPEAFIGHADKLFDAAGTLGNESTRAFLGKFLAAFAAWVERNPSR